MQREKEFVKNSAILSLGTIVPKITSIITLPIITGCLTKAEYGVYDIVTVLVFLFLPIATLQIQSAAFRFLILARDNEEEQKRIVTNIVIFTFPVCIVALAILFFFLWDINPGTRLLILVYYLADTLLITVRQVARGLSKNLFYSVSALINSVLELVLTFVLLYILRKALNSAIIALVIPQVVSLIFLCLSIKIFSFVELKYFSLSYIKKMIAYSWAMIPNSLSSWVMRVSDRVILIWFLGSEVNAVYAAANKLPNMFNIVQSTFSLAWQENASISVNDADAGDYYGKMFDRVFNVFVGIMALLIAFTPVLFKLLIRGDYAEAYNHMPILYIAALFATVSSYIGGIYIAHMKSKQIGISTTIAAAMNFAINLVFVKKYGIYAASVSTLISYLWLAIYRMINIQKIQRIKFDYIRIASLSLLLATMAGVCFIRNWCCDIINILVAMIVSVGLNRKIIVPIVGKLIKKRR